MADLATTNNTNAIQSGSNFEIPRGFICTLDLSEIEGKMKLAAALNGATSLTKAPSPTLNVTNIVTTQGVRSRTGEECINTYLICDDDSVYFSQSDGIARSVKVLVAAFTDPNTGVFVNPVDLGVAFEIRSQVLDNGNTLKCVVPVKVA